MIQTFEDMLKACAIDFKGNLDDYFHLIEFAYNNCIALLALYGRRCRSNIGRFEVEVVLIGPDIVCEAIEKNRLIRER